jgi:uncharacterized membrane protein YoaK (UPF0700 family)
MNTAFLTDIRDTIIPDRDGRHGPLPPLLLSMTLVTGLVDAFSYLVLGHVFVANMTGNVVFLGFALAGAPGFSVPASLAAVAFFALGALIGGKLGSRYRDHRGRLHSSAAAIQALFLGISVILAVIGSPVTAGYRYGLIAVLGISMGIQNASARKLAVPDLTTTVLTLTITGIAADSALAGGSGSKAGRRLLAVVTMLAGALLGAALIRHAQPYYSLVIALAVIALGAAVAYTLGRPDPAWGRPPGLAAPGTVADQSPSRPDRGREMPVERTHADHQTRYELHDGGALASVLTYTAAADEPATWKILLPGPGGTEDLYGTQRILTPDVARLRTWLAPVIGADQAAELAHAVNAAPPPAAGWKQPDSHDG